MQYNGNDKTTADFRSFFENKCEKLFMHFGMEAVDLYNSTANQNKDALRYKWLRRNIVKLSFSDSLIAALVKDQSELDAAMKENP